MCCFRTLSDAIAPPLIGYLSDPHRACGGDAAPATREALGGLLILIALTTVGKDMRG